MGQASFAYNFGSQNVNTTPTGNIVEAPESIVRDSTVHAFILFAFNFVILLYCPKKLLIYGTQGQIHITDTLT